MIFSFAELFHSLQESLISVYCVPLSIGAWLVPVRKGAIFPQIFTMKHRRQTIAQPQQIFTALILTSILSLAAGISILDSAIASVPSSRNSQSNLLKDRDRHEDRNHPHESQDRDRENRNHPHESNANKLPREVINAVRQDLSKLTGITNGQLKLVSATQETWSDSCLGLGRLDESCAQMLVEGWRVVMSNGSQTWNYRTDSNGTIVRLDSQNSDNQSGNLPNSVANAVLQAASQRTGLSISQLRIIKSVQVGTDGCLSLPRPDEICTKIAMMAWEVTVAAKEQRLVYRSDNAGVQVRLNEAASNISDTKLPKSVSDRILQLASELLELPISQFQIIKAEQQTWNNACLDLQRPEERCMGVLTPGWRVTVKNKEQRLVYHSDREGSRIRFNQAASKLSEGNQSGGGVQIPKDQLPQPLAQGEIFRAITTGGFANLHYQTTLMNDGRVIRVQVNQNNNTTSQQVIRQISRQELREFQRLLEQQKFAKLNQLDFPAPSGAADYFTVTLTSKTATTRYADIGTEQLPTSLQSVIQAWSKIISQ